MTVFLAFFGLAAGAVTAAGYFALITSVGMINRAAASTGTTKSIFLTIRYGTTLQCAPALTDWRSRPLTFRLRSGTKAVGGRKTISRICCCATER